MSSLLPDVFYKVILRRHAATVASCKNIPGSGNGGASMDFAHAFGFDRPYGATLHRHMRSLPIDGLQSGNSRKDRTHLTRGEQGKFRAAR